MAIISIIMGIFLLLCCCSQMHCYMILFEIISLFRIIFNLVALFTFVQNGSDAPSELIGVGSF